MEEREIVADLILESLDADTLSSVDQAWRQEAEARYQRYRDGQSETVTGIRLERNPRILRKGLALSVPNAEFISP